jgi:hypothetical protein
MQIWRLFWGKKGVQLKVIEEIGGQILQKAGAFGVFGGGNLQGRFGEY